MLRLVLLGQLPGEEELGLGGVNRHAAAIALAALLLAGCGQGVVASHPS
jgi:hypothetical protein